jgi:hypothetical protein
LSPFLITKRFGIKFGGFTHSVNSDVHLEN